MGSRSPRATLLHSPPAAESIRGFAYNFARPAASWEGSSWHAVARPGLSSPLTQEPQWENYSHPGKRSEIRARLCSLALRALGAGILLLSLLAWCRLWEPRQGKGEGCRLSCPVVCSLGSGEGTPTCQCRPSPASKPRLRSGAAVQSKWSNHGAQPGWHIPGHRSVSGLAPPARGAAAVGWDAAAFRDELSPCSCRWRQDRHRYASLTISLYQFHAWDLPKICPFSIGRIAREGLLLHPQTLARRHCLQRPWQSHATL